MLKTIGWFFYYELLLYIRRAHEWIYPLVFFVIVLSLFPLAIAADENLLKKIAPGAIWIAALLSSLLALENMLTSDKESGFLEQSLLNSQPLPLLIFIKLIAHWLVAELPLILFSPLLAWIFHLSFPQMVSLTTGLLLGTPLLSLLGLFGVCLTLGLRYQGMLLGLLILPLMTPVLIFGVTMVEQSAAGLSISGNIAMLFALMIFGSMSIPFAAASVLRMGMDD